MNKQTADFERGAIVAALFKLCHPLATMDTLQKGDTVQLKSGGPVMTVGGTVAHSTQVQCQWFAGTELKSGAFYPEQLKKAEPHESEEEPGSGGLRMY
jgi:uncharacterized protein YodC (DUF2158 family)